MINYKNGCIILSIIFVLLLMVLLYRVYINKKIIEENFADVLTKDYTDINELFNRAINKNSSYIKTILTDEVQNIDKINLIIKEDFRISLKNKSFKEIKENYENTNYITELLENITSTNKEKLISSTQYYVTNSLEDTLTNQKIEQLSLSINKIKGNTSDVSLSNIKEDVSLLAEKISQAANNQTVKSTIATLKNNIDSNTKEENDALVSNITSLIEETKKENLEKTNELNKQISDQKEKLNNYVLDKDVIGSNDLKTISTFLDQLQKDTIQRFKNLNNEMERIESNISNKDNDFKQRLIELESVTDDFIKKKTTVSKQYSDFSESLKQLGTFHDTYQKNLEEILERKFDVNDIEYNIRRNRQLKRLKGINRKLDKLKKLNTNSKDKKIRSIKCMGTGDRLNVAPLRRSSTPNNTSFNLSTDKYLIFLNNKCLNVHNLDLDGYDIANCDANALNQQFRIIPINNEEEYNNMIDKDISSEPSKPYPSDEAFIEYPFKLVVPVGNGSDEFSGKCLTIDDNGISIETCKSTPNQRFKTSSVRVESAKCNLNVTN